MINKEELQQEENNKNNIIIYQSEDGKTHIEVRMDEETVWLTQAQIGELFNKSKSTISEHIKNIFEEGELEKDSVVRNFRTTANDGKKYETLFYNLDVIISVGYRVKSIQGTHFRRWATERLKEYIIKGFTMDDERLKQVGGGGYWKELLDRIRDIRSSEKVMYRQVLDIYATAVDYDPRSDQSVDFFKIVQNKLHFAAHGHTAAEVIYERANADQPMMGLILSNTVLFMLLLPAISFFRLMYPVRRMEARSQQLLFGKTVTFLDRLYVIFDRDTFYILMLMLFHIIPSFSLKFVTKITPFQ